MSKSIQPASERLTDGVSRRDLLIGASAMATALASGVVFAGDKPGHRHENHAPKHPDLLNLMNNCVDKGQQCITHCLVAFREGDTSLADCASKVHEMEAICRAFSYLLAANSSYVKPYAKLCKMACVDCEEECRKHDEHHVECRECADACQQVVKTLDAVFV